MDNSHFKYRHVVTREVVVSKRAFGIGLKVGLAMTSSFRHRRQQHKAPYLQAGRVSVLKGEMLLTPTPKFRELIRLRKLEPDLHIYLLYLCR